MVDLDAYDFTPEKFGLVHEVRRNLEAARLRRWCRGLPDDARILDVGCGDGFHLRILRDFGRPGWRVEGVEPDPRAAAAARASRARSAASPGVSGSSRSPGSRRLQASAPGSLMRGPTERLRELGLVLPPVATPIAAYVPSRRSGDLVYTSGQLPLVAGSLVLPDAQRCC